MSEELVPNENNYNTGYAAAPIGISEYGRAKIAAKMAGVAARVGYVQKGSTNTGQGYRYASAEDVLKKVNAALSEANIATQVETRSFKTTTRDLGKGPQVDVFMTLRVHFVDGDSGQSLYADGNGSGSDKGDKAVMKAHTAAYKYAMAAAFQISWGDDPEADASQDRHEAVEGPNSPPKARRGRPTGKKAAEPAVTSESLLEAITQASHEQLQELRIQLKKLRDKKPDEAEPLIAAFKARVIELNAPTEAAKESN